jgi:hypothetical protein
MKILYHIFTNKYNSHYIANADECVYCGETGYSLHCLLSNDEKNRIQINY